MVNSLTIKNILANIILISCLLVSITAIPTNATELSWVGVNRIVVIGATGTYKDAQKLLEEASVIDQKGHWIAGQTHLVRVGNLPAQDIEAGKLIKFLIKIQKQAKTAGGNVHSIMGTDDLKVLTKKNYRTSLQQHKQWLNSTPPMIQINDILFVSGGLSEKLLNKDLKSIYKNKNEDIESYLSLVKTLKTKGVLPQESTQEDHQKTLKELLEKPKVTAEVLDQAKVLHELYEGGIFSDSSPLSYAATAHCHPYNESFTTERVLSNFGASRVVIATNTINNQDIANERIISRMDGLVLWLNTHSAKGKPSLLLIEGDKILAHYLGESGNQVINDETRHVAIIPGNLSDKELEQFLLTADIIKRKKIGIGITNSEKISLNKNNLTMNASFKRHDTNPNLEKRKTYSYRIHNKSDRYIYDMAAYRLDRLLNMYMVPAAVIRKIDGRQGLVQYWMNNTINEKERREQKIPFSSVCDNTTQFRLRFIFDTLVYNEDRNLTNMLYRKDDFMLRFIDHSLAFRTTVKRPKMYAKVKLELSDLFRKSLTKLTLEELQQELGSYLHPLQIEAIIARRDLILKETK